MYDFHNVGLTPFETMFLNVCILSIIIFALLHSERKLGASNQIAMLVILAIFGISGRILMEPLPNIQPVTVIIILAGVYYGAPRAIALAGVIALFSNLLVMGHGPWTIFQVIGWGLVGLFGAITSKYILENGELNLHRLGLIAILSAFAFDWVVSSSILLKTDPSMLMPYLINGLLFDLYHAVGNLLFVAWLASPLGEIMHRHKVEHSHKAVNDIAHN
tara:strand:+ start:12104 stop:12757 length:654 start_codon:yes stop_codon:yes gene_type:complete